jgi:hypothetical protein
VRKYLYGLGLLLYILFASAFVQPIETSRQLEKTETSETLKNKKNRKNKWIFRR